MTKWAVVGSRNFPDRNLVRQFLDAFLRPGDIIVSGGAKGPDSWAREYAHKRLYGYEEYAPDWSKGKHAGLERNSDIVENSDQVLAFWDGNSRGTQDTVNKAQRAGKLTVVVTR